MVTLRIIESNLADVSTSNSQFKIVIEGKILINQLVEISYPD